MITATTVRKHCKPTEIKKAIAKSIKPIDDSEAHRAMVKVRIHIVCIILCGCISFALYANKIGNPTLNGFGPFCPSLIQEVLDWFKHT